MHHDGVLTYIRSLHFLQLDRDDLIVLAMDDRKLAEKIRDRYPDRFAGLDFGDIPYRQKPDTDQILAKYDFPDPPHKQSLKQRRYRYRAYWQGGEKEARSKKYHAKK